MIKRRKRGVLGTIAKQKRQRKAETNKGKESHSKRRMERGSQQIDQMSKTHDTNKWLKWLMRLNVAVTSVLGLIRYTFPSFKRIVTILD
jgi:hypothetical protein